LLREAGSHVLWHLIVDLRTLFRCPVRRDELSIGREKQSDRFDIRVFQAASNVFTSFWSATPSRESSAGGLAALSAVPARAIGKDENQIETHKAANDVLAIWKSI
jgi:hypothetical protein